MAIKTTVTKHLSCTHHLAKYLTLKSPLITMIKLSATHLKGSWSVRNHCVSWEADVLQ